MMNVHEVSEWRKALKSNYVPQQPREPMQASQGCEGTLSTEQGKVLLSAFEDKIACWLLDG